MESVTNAGIGLQNLEYQVFDLWSILCISVCWSPKGKQLVIGTGNGTLMQFDHELKKKRDWARPSVLPEDQQFEGQSSITAPCIHW